jgi:hypothetical protein
MSAAIINVKVFNNLLTDFLNFLESNFPMYSSDIKLSKSMVDIIKLNNPRLVVEQFMKNISPYKTQILDCNESFFLDFEKTIKISSNNLIHGLKIKNVWTDPNTTKHQKAYIWLYFQKLIKSGERALV